MSVPDAIPTPRPPVDDDALLRAMGITPVLARRQNRLAAWAAPFNIISVITGVVGTLALGLTVGPAGMFWGWIIVSCATLVVGVVMAELASSMPTAAALYQWTQQLAPPRRAARLSNRVGWLNFLGLLGGVSSVAYGGAVSLQALLALQWGYTPTPGKTLAITGALLVLYALVNTLDIGRVAAVNKLSVGWLIGGTALIVAVLAALPHHHQSAGFVLTHVANETGFSANWYALAIVLACGSYVYCGYDLAAHLSEETLNAARTVPHAILRSIWVSAITGILLIGALLFAIQNYDGELTSATGSPTAQIFLDALGPNWAKALLIVALGAQMFCGVAVTTAASRQVFAFSGRNRAFPGHRWWSQVSPRTRVPVPAVWLSAALGFVLVLPLLWNTVALNAVININVIGLLPAYAVPIYLRLRHRTDRFIPGPWHVGAKAGAWYARIALVWIVAACVAVALPQVGPWNKITWSNLNYAFPVFALTLILEAIWWAAYGRNHYTPPLAGVSPAQAAALQEEIR